MKTITTLFLTFIILTAFLPSKVFGANETSLPQSNQLSPFGAARFSASPDSEEFAHKQLLLASIRDQLAAIKTKLNLILKLINR